MEAEIKRACGSETEVALIAGSNGVFEVTGDGKLLFSKRQLGRFPDPGEVVALLKAGA